jgi:DnaJ-class molecular chaperone
MAMITGDDARDVVDKLDELCWNCGGNGKGPNGDCAYCDGVGTQLTDAGHEMIAFIVRNEKRIAAVKERGE